MKITIDGVELSVMLDMEQVLPFIGICVGVLVVGWMVTSILLQKTKDEIMDGRVKTLEHDWMEYILADVDQMKKKANRYDILVGNKEPGDDVENLKSLG